MRKPAIRRSQSAWRFVAPDVVTACVAQLARDLESGAWDERYGALRTRPE